MIKIELMTNICLEASRGAITQSVTVTRLIVDWRNCNIYLNIYFHFWALVEAALCSAAQYVMPLELSEKRGTEYLNAGFPI